MPNITYTYTCKKTLYLSARMPIYYIDRWSSTLFQHFIYIHFTDIHHHHHILNQTIFSLRPYAIRKVIPTLSPTAHHACRHLTNDIYICIIICSKLRFVYRRYFKNVFRNTLFTLSSFWKNLRSVHLKLVYYML